MPTVLIVSKDTDFSGVVAQAVERELAVQALTAASAEEAQAPAKAAQVIVSSDGLAGKWPAPVIAVKARPIKLAGLLAEINEALAKEQPDIKLGREHLFSPQAKTITQLGSGKKATLTGKEAALLMLLAQDRNKSVSREAILKNVWDSQSELETHALETHIYRLRAKLADAGFKGSITAGAGGYALKIK